MRAAPKSLGTNQRGERQGEENKFLKLSWLLCAQVQLRTGPVPSKIRLISISDPQCRKSRMGAAALIPASAEPLVHGQMAFGFTLQQGLLFSVGHAGAELFKICP